jgi:hypothetical protein
VSAAQEHLAAFALHVAGRLGGGPLDGSWAGSLMDDAWFRGGVQRSIAEGDVEVRWCEPASDAALAAAREATRL